MINCKNCVFLEMGSQNIIDLKLWMKLAVWKNSWTSSLLPLFNQPKPGDEILWIVIAVNIAKQGQE